MNNKKVLLIIATCLVVFGGIIVGLGVSTVLSHPDKYTTKTKKDLNLEKKEFKINYQNIDEVVADLISEDVDIVLTENKDFIIEYYDDSESPLYKVNTDDNKISIVRTSNSTNSIINIPDIAQEIARWDDYTETQNVKIYIPSEYEGRYNIQTVSGNISMANVPTKSTLDLDTVSGDISLKEIYCEENAKTVMDTVSGDIYIEGCGFDNQLNCSTTSGDINITGASVYASCSLSTVSGDCTVKDFKVHTLDINTTSGDTTITTCTPAVYIKGDSVSGDFYLDIQDDINKYSSSFDSVSGECNYVNEVSGKEKSISLSTTSGDAQITFSPIN